MSQIMTVWIILPYIANLILHNQEKIRSACMTQALFFVYIFLNIKFTIRSQVHKSKEKQVVSKVG